MPQKEVWEREYERENLVSGNYVPQKIVRRFKKFLRQEGWRCSELRVLDLGAGNGKHAEYFASCGAVVTGVEIASNAVTKARTHAQTNGLQIDYHEGDIGQPFDFPSAQFSAVLDIMSSNSLNETERATCLSETRRVLRPGGYFFVRALCLEGDTNAKTLLATYPGPEPYTYVLPGLQITERVFSKADFIATYQPYFQIRRLEKLSSYTRLNNQRYKRNFWVAYLQKP